MLLAAGCAERALPLPEAPAPAVPDLAVPADLSAPGDFAVRDLRDLSVPRDLAVPDLSVPRDLTPPPDLRPNGDAGLEVRFGNVAPLPDVSPHLSGDLLGRPVQVTQPVRLVRIGIEARQTCMHAVLALYSDASGTPGQLLSSTASTSVAMGPNEFAAAPVDLTTGTYWIMGEYDVTCPIGIDFSKSTPTKYITFVYGTPLPAQFPASPSSYTGYPANYWIVGVPE
jgi:hypothetical protein